LPTALPPPPGHAPDPTPRPEGRRTAYRLLILRCREPGGAVYRRPQRSGPCRRREAYVWPLSPAIPVIPSVPLFPRKALPPLPSSLFSYERCALIKFFFSLVKNSLPISSLQPRYVVSF